MMNILVTGADRFIGCHLVEKLVIQGIEFGYLKLINVYYFVVELESLIDISKSQITIVNTLGQSSWFTNLSNLARYKTDIYNV